MSEPVADDNVKSSQLEESESLLENGVEAHDARDTRGSTLESVQTGTQSSESKQFMSKPVRERILRQRKQINYAEPADNPLKDTVRIQSNYNHKEEHTDPVRRRGRPPKYTNNTSNYSQSSNRRPEKIHLDSSPNDRTSLSIRSRYPPPRYSKRTHQEDEADDDGDDEENEDYSRLPKKVRRLSRHGDSKDDGSTRYNMRTRSKEADYAVDNRDDLGDDEEEDEDEPEEGDAARENESHRQRRATRYQLRILESPGDAGSPSVDEERAPNAQYSLRSRKNVSYSEAHSRPDYEQRAGSNAKQFSPSLRATRMSRWRMSNDTSTANRNLPSEKAYHLRKRAHPPNFYTLPPPPIVPPKAPVSRPHRPLRGASIYRHAGSGSSDEESIRRNVKQLRAGETGSKILPLNLLDLKGSRDDSLLGPAILNDQTSISEKVDGQTFNFESIGGLDHHIKSLKEMILLPLLYPELYANFQITPPRGALLYGPPGTGKTLMARALANSCSTQSQKVAFFMRKGADCLSKWVGEAERELKLLFEEAKKWQPSIIFFDEIDGLAPVRSAKAEQTHTSVVSTLLALMDGLDSRGQVIVLGATNRIDAIDPALRRPGRFDREFYFPLPNEEARNTIIDIATSDWKPPIAPDFRKKLAQVSKGYSGADLKALCTEAALNSIRRTYPQIYDSSERLLVSPQDVHVQQHDFLDSAKSLVPSSHRSADAVAAPLTESLSILLRGQFDQVKEKVFKIISQKAKTSVIDEGVDEVAHDLSVEQEHFTLTGSSEMRTFRPRLLLSGKQGLGQKHIAAAVLDALDGHHIQSFDLAMLMGDSTPEAICVQLFTEVKRHRPGVIYIPHIHIWWHTVSDMLRLTFINLLNDINPHHPILLLATSEIPFEDLPKELQHLFERCMLGNVALRHANKRERVSFFQGIITRSAKSPKDYTRRQDAETEKAQVHLPKAPPLPTRQLTEIEKQKLKKHDIHVLREFRRELRCIIEDMLKSKRYKYFAHPVDNEEYPEYDTLIRHPMDLNKIMHKINEGKYFRVADFLRDISIIRYNTEFYHGADDDLTIRAYALVDDVESFVHALNPELIAELAVTAKRRKLVKDEEKKASINHRYFTRTASSITTRGMEKRSNDVPMEETADPEYNDYISKLQDSYDSGLQSSFVTKDPLALSDTEETVGRDDPKDAPRVETPIPGPINDTIAERDSTKETGPATPEKEIITVSEEAGAIVDVENNPFAAIIEEGKRQMNEEDRQHDAGHLSKLTTLDIISHPFFNHARIDVGIEMEEDNLDVPSPEVHTTTNDNSERQIDDVAENHKDMTPQPETPKELYIDIQALHDVVESVADVSDGWSVDELCHLRAELFVSVHNHRMDWDKTNLLQDLRKITRQFALLHSA
ncbi:hypothetical protein NQZ79_g4929 [Umbelopsis isabellina]|nr:hypothetical protein NQZ79_g4929 [Umbelopsis isabellina]